MLIPRSKLGVCTWMYGDLPLVEVVDRVVSLGLDGVMLAGDVARYAREQLSAPAVGQLFQDNELAIFGLSPLNVDLAHPDTAVRQSAIDHYWRLIEFAAGVGAPLVSVRGFVGRVKLLTSLEEEMSLLETAVRPIAERARKQGVRLALEILNRYESHLINNGTEALAFIQGLEMDNVGVSLNSFHMNIEEQYAAGTIRQVGDLLWLYQMADSNRQGIGRGHIKFGDQLWALEDIGYRGPIIFDFRVPGPDPYALIKDEKSLVWLETNIRESRAWF